MQVGETVRVAVDALRANKLRSFLTMLGIVIGVAAVIAMVALGRGAERSVRARIASLGTTLLSVLPGQARGGGGIASATDRAQLRLRDAEAIERDAEHAVAVQPEMSRSAQVQYLNQNTNTNIVGTTANYLEVRNFTLATGRMFSAREGEARKRLAVLGPEVVADLSVTADGIVGETVRIDGIAFEVAGVLASKGQGGGFGNPDDQVLIPIGTAQERITGSDRLRSINVLAATEADIPATMAEISRILRREHRLRIGQEDDFRLRNQADFLTTLGETSQIFTLLLAGIAAVSLLVGGIGIMNIMLVSVTERTREIGVRKALGATRRTILLQFLIEALVLCLLGGLVGVGLGVGTAVGLREAFAWDTAVDGQSVVLALLFSGSVGVLFGVWPARRAASLDPISSLRYE
ncbi:MAG TPA: ABC transporter permease [Candidatus Eisenbacteria bacterium]|nr:ABC transporter permease [Candidatus Eisenbacteria bacterium]